METSKRKKKNSQKAFLFLKEIANRKGLVFSGAFTQLK